MTSALRILGLDLGNQTGYALAEGGKIARSGVRDFSIKKHQHKGERGIAFYNFLLTFGVVDEIYVEAVMFGGNFKNKEGKWISPSSDGRELYHGLLMLVQMFAAGTGVEVYPIHNGTLKKEFAGHGGAEKADMCATARAMGWKGGTANTALFHDEVDAIALVETQMRLKHGIRITF